MVVFIVLAAAAISSAQTTSQSACLPAGASVNPRYQMTVGHVAAALTPDTAVDLLIAPAIDAAQMTNVCFDGATVAPSNVTSTNGTTTFTIRVPTPAAGSPPFADQPSHTVSVLLGTSGIIQTTLLPQIRLTAVTVRPASPQDPRFRVVLLGQGFNPGDPLSHTVMIARQGAPALSSDVCWTDADCNLKGSNIRGTIRGGTEIEIAGLNPGIERMAQFTVCVSGTCSSPPMRDAEARSLFWVPGAAFVCTLVMAALVVGAVTRLKPIEINAEQYLIKALFIDKETNTYSLSRLQFYMWTFVSVFGYVGLLLSRWWVQGQWSLPPMPSGLPGIVGLAAGTSVGAQVVTSMNGPKGSGEMKPSLADFVTSGGLVAPDRVQFLVWTVVGSIGYFMVLTALDPRVITDLPEVPWSVLSISGVSALGYLGGKFARTAGPVINEVMVRVGPDPATAAAAPGAPAAGAGAQFGLIEIRGRTLSPDGTFRISVNDIPENGGDVPISFDRLQPKPAAPSVTGTTPASATPEPPKPRVLEIDPDNTGMAKRLLLVLKLDLPEIKALFAANTKHTITITNLDSQKAVFTFTVPDTQKAS